LAVGAIAKMQKVSGCKLVNSRRIHSTQGYTLRRQIFTTNFAPWP
jgi:hypothetical protein